MAQTESWNVDDRTVCYCEPEADEANPCAHRLPERSNAQPERSNAWVLNYLATEISKAQSAEELWQLESESAKYKWRISLESHFESQGIDYFDYQMWSFTRLHALGMGRKAQDRQRRKMGDAEILRTLEDFCKRKASPACYHLTRARCKAQEQIYQLSLKESQCDQQREAQELGSAVDAILRSAVQGRSDAGFMRSALEVKIKDMGHYVDRDRTLQMGLQ